MEGLTSDKREGVRFLFQRSWDRHSLSFSSEGRPGPGRAQAAAPAVPRPGRAQAAVSDRAGHKLQSPAGQSTGYSPGGARAGQGTGCCPGRAPAAAAGPPEAGWELWGRAGSEPGEGGQGCPL